MGRPERLWQFACLGEVCSARVRKSLNLAILKIIHWERLKLMPLGEEGNGS